MEDKIESLNIELGRMGSTRTIIRNIRDICDVMECSPKELFIFMNNKLRGGVTFRETGEIIIREVLIHNLELNLC